MTSDSGPGQIHWDLIPDTSAELFDDLSNARDALAKGKFANAEKIGMSILARLSDVTGQTEHESAIPPSALRAPAEAVVGIAAHEQGRPDVGKAHLSAATSIFGDLLDAGYELDAASRGDYIRALLLTDRAGPALEITRAALESGRELPSPVVLQIASALRDAGRTEPAIDLLRLAHRRQPGRIDIADALARALEEDAQQDAAAKAHLEAAVLLARQGDHAESEAHFRRSLAGAPGSPAAITGLAQVLLAQGKTEQAIQTVQLSADQGLQAPEIAAVRAEVFAKAGDITRAIEAARDGLAIFRGNPALIRTYVRILIEAGKAEDAAPLLERALAKNPNDVDLLQAKAVVLLGRGKPTEAIAILRPLIEEFPESTRQRATLVRALIAAGDALGASDALAAGLSMRPDDAALVSEQAAVAASLVWYARLHFKETENPSVRLALERVVALIPEYWLAHAWLGEIMLREGDFTGARVHLDLAARGMPGSAWVAGTHGQALYALGQPEALDELRRGADLDVDGRLPWLHTQLGDAYRLAHRYQEALAELDRATKLAPGDAWTWAVTGATQSLLGDWEKARYSLDEAIRLNPGYAWALAVKANLLAKIDQLDDALRTIGASLHADPKLDWAWGLKSSLLDRLDLDPAEQEQAARNGLQLQPGDSYLLIRLAEALLRQQRDDEAESNFRAGIDSAEANSALRADNLQYQAWCHLRLREYDQALDCLTTLLVQNYKQIAAGYDLGLVLLCAGRHDVALDQYEEVAAQTRSEPHVGRRQNLVGVAQHDLQRILERGQIKRGPEVERVEEILNQVLVTDSAADTQR